jgi:DNA-binding transcriptional ArsR family regulator
MDDLQPLVRVALACADERRLRILLTLIEGEATVSDLVTTLGLPQPRVSSHLSVLRDAGLVTRRSAGRQRTYGVDAGRIGAVIEALRTPANVGSPQPPRSAQADREVRRDSPIRRARACYDHLAGVAAIELLEELMRRDWLTGPFGDRRDYALTEVGATVLAQRGVDVEHATKARRRFAFGCIDWTERRPHLGGALGAEVLLALERGGVVQPSLASRVVTLHAPVIAWLGSARLV